MRGRGDVDVGVEGSQHGYCRTLSLHPFIRLDEL